MFGTCLITLFNHCSSLYALTHHQAVLCLLPIQVLPDTFEVVNVEFNEDELIKQLPSGPVHIISIGGWSFSRADQVFK